MSQYIGKYINGHYQVTKDKQILNGHQDITNHSPMGFAWGYPGSGPAQLALALMVEEFGSDISKHPIHYQVFKDKVIARLDGECDWSLSSNQIQAFIECEIAGAL